ncbi:hypothetical protein Tco_0145887 [Tanacetum coccineum]
MERVVQSRFCPTSVNTDDSGPRMSFDIPASLERVSGLDRASMEKIISCVVSFRGTEGDYTSSCPSILVLYITALTWFILGHISLYDAVGVGSVRVSFRTMLSESTIKCLTLLGLEFLFLPSCYPSLNIQGSLLLIRHPESVITDPKPPAGSYDELEIRRLSAFVVKLRDMSEEVLVFFGLSRVWKSCTCDPFLIDPSGNGANEMNTLLQALKLIDFVGTTSTYVYIRVVIGDWD